MAEGDFLQLMKDCQLLDPHLTPLQTKHIFAHTQLVPLVAVLPVAAWEVGVR